ncbi:MAG: DegQ family serine endoprotease [Nitrospirota bacterium]|jgi:serine protease Do
MKRKTLTISGMALLIAIGLVLGLTLSSDLDIQNKGYSQPVPEEAVKTLTQVSEALVRVAEAVKPSVVNISSTHTVQRRVGPPGLFQDPFFRRFFGDEFFKQYGEPQEETRVSLGSGVIVDPSGYIVTNYHVVKDAEEIHVTVVGKGEFKGKVVGSDPPTDLAVVKIDAKGLTAAAWGDSDALKAGEVVIAVGSPYGLTQSVTMGIVSAIGRANVRIADYEDFIQTDAAINPGNSGGPLVNPRGEVVGINTAIFTTTGGYQGIGFSIPSNMARTVMKSLIEKGRVIRGWLGVTIQPITPELAKQFGLKEVKGVLVSDVVEKSPAAEAGLERGDIIVSYEGKEVKSPRELRNMVASTSPGGKAKLTVVRKGEEKTLSVTIGQLPEHMAAARGQLENVLKGISVQNLTPQVRDQLGVPARVQGVVITDAPSGTGLRRGDVIVEVDREPVPNVEKYNEVASKVPSGQNVLLLILRQGSYLYLTLSP